METEILEKKKLKIQPKLRFPEFQEDWINRKLGEVCSVKTGNKDTQDRVEDGNYPFFVRSNTVERINSYSFDGEAILTSGDGIGVGKNFHYINGKFGYHQRVYALTDFYENYSGKFIFQLFQEKFFRRVMRLSAKNSVDSVRMSMITDMPINFPTFSEQQKIASFLSAVDQKIRQLTRKKALLEAYKKGAMQKLFSQQIRFRNENGKEFPEWEKKKLGEIATFSKGKGVSKNDIFEDGSISCIRYGELYTHYNETIKHTISKTNIPEEDLTLSEAGDVIIPASGETRLDIATASCVLNEGIALGGDLNIIRGDFNGVFLAYFLNNHLKIDIARLSQGSSVIHLYSSQLKKLELRIPSAQEQQKIADFLSAIDRKIEAVSQQIEKTQSFKKGLLQQMFV